MLTEYKAFNVINICFVILLTEYLYTFVSYYQFYDFHLSFRHLNWEEIKIEFFISYKYAGSKQSTRLA